MASALFSPITLRGLTLPNRVVVSPMCQYNSDNGSANDWHLMHLGNMSLGAAGLVITEMTNVNPQGRISPKCAGIWSDENEASLKRVLDFCRKYGVAKLGVQLAHAGRKGPQVPPGLGGKPMQPTDEGGWVPEAPSAGTLRSGAGVSSRAAVSTAFGFPNSRTRRGMSSGERSASASECRRRYARLPQGLQGSQGFQEVRRECPNVSPSRPGPARSWLPAGRPGDRRGPRHLDS